MDLKQILGDDLFKAVTEKLGDKYRIFLHEKDAKVIVDDGKMIPKERFDQVNEQRKALDEQIKAITKQLDELKGKAGESEELKKQIQAFQEQYQATQKEFEARLKQQDFDFRLDRALREKYQAKSSKSVKAELDLAKISLDGENFIGLEEQIKNLKTAQPWQFGVEKITGNPPKDTPGPIDEVTFEDVQKLKDAGNPAWKDQYTKYRKQKGMS